MTVDPEEREVVSSSIFVPSAEEGELNENGAGNHFSPISDNNSGSYITEKIDRNTVDGDASVTVEHQNGYGRQRGRNFMGP